MGADLALLSNFAACNITVSRKMKLLEAAL